MRVRIAAVPRKIRQVRRHPSNDGAVGRQALTATKFEIASVFGRSVSVPFSRSLRVTAAKRGDSSGRVPYARLPDWPEMAVWRSLLTPGDIFVDVGANVGLYTLLALEAGATAIAVEPAADMQSLLTDNVASNRFAPAELHRAALMDKPGTALLDGPDPNRRSVAAGASGHGDGEMVVASTLDLVIAGRPVRGVKIDVEGMEHAVLLGGQLTLATPELELEWNDASLGALGEDRSAVAALLEASGFCLHQPDEAGKMVAFEAGTVLTFGRDVLAARGRALAHLETAAWEHR